jgi:predicted transposase/invertase (TIGR01784 family)
MRAERAVNGITRDYLKAARQMAIMKNSMDRAQMIYDAKQEGLQAGMAQSTLEIAYKMKKMGDSVEKIHTITGLPIETIEQM